MSSSFEVLKSRIEGKECAVLGFGISNIPLVRVLLDLGTAKSISVYDKKPLSELGEDAAELSAHGVVFITGAESFEKIDGDVIFRSPGIRPDIPALREALARGACLTSEIEQLLALTHARTFALTGSDGKTTSTTLTGKFLEAAGKRVFVGGNIGRPLLQTCEEMNEEDACVLELSSFQLMRMPFSPEYCAITNVSPNHLDWHTDEGEYFGAKKNIVGENTRRLVVNADCAATADFGCEVVLRGDKEVIFFSSSKDNYADVVRGTEGSKAVYRRDGVIYLSDGKGETAMLAEREIRLPGVHNIENYMTAIALCSGFVSADDILTVAREFTGVEHRLEPVRTLDGVDYINGSIDSSPTRTIAALSALSGRDIVLICGGYDKNLDYAPLAPSLCKNVRVLVLTGATADKIEASLRACPAYSGSPAIVRAKSFDEAVTLARDNAAKGGCVLLSPASASFDQFKNFAERGRYFKELVRKLS